MIKNGHTNEALSFTQKLTESIAVEMSAINTNHPVVNAVLNQKYRSMQEKHIAVILKVGDLQEICLEEEEIVIDRKSTRLNSSHTRPSRMPSSA